MTALKRAVIYTRYSSDLQDASSIEGQNELCRANAERQGFTIVDYYEDRAKSSASEWDRPGVLALMRDIALNKFDAIWCEHSDRLTRDAEFTAKLMKRTRFYNIQIITVSNGPFDAMQAGFQAMAGEQFIRNLADKTRRGLAQKLREGKSPGGKSFGYRPVIGQKGVLEIVPHEAAVVVRIFAEYLAGKTPRDIAGGLNRDGITAPRGGKWNASTINGNAVRGHGILLNPLYAGRMAFNRVGMVKHPDTQRRISRANARDDWQFQDHPELRIVDQKTFDEVAQRKAATRKMHASGHRSPRNLHLLSGLLKCGSCGAGMSSVGVDHGRQRVRCSRSKESGACENTRNWYLDEIIAATITNLRDWLADNAKLKTFVDAYTAEWKALNSAALRERDSIERRALDVDGQLKRLVTATAKGTLPEEEIEAMAKPLMIERTQLRAELARADQAVPKIYVMPNAVAAYHETMENLAENLGLVRADDTQARAAINRLIGEVIVHLTDPATVTVNGRILAITSHAKASQSAASIGMVAREGLEPPTPGL